MVSEDLPDIVLAEAPLDPAEVRRLVARHFEDEAVRLRVREIAFQMIGRGEPLP